MNNRIYLYGSKLWEADARGHLLAVAELTEIATPIYRMIEAGKIVPDRDKREALYEALDFSWTEDGDDSSLEN